MPTLPPIVVFRLNRELERRLRDASSFAALLTTFTPDHIVYAGADPLFVPARPDPEEQDRALREALAAHHARTGSMPRVVGVQGLGVFCRGADRRAAGQVLALLLDALKVSVYAESFGGPRPMPPGQVEFIRTWEVESYRQKVAAGAAAGAGLPRGAAWPAASPWSPAPRRGSAAASPRGSPPRAPTSSAPTSRGRRCGERRRPSGGGTARGAPWAWRPTSPTRPPCAPRSRRPSWNTAGWTCW